MRKTVTFKGIKYNKYEIDNLGNVYRKGNDEPLKPFGDGRGYNRVDLMSDRNERISAKIHLIMAHTFLGKQKPGIIVNHKDGNKSNNSLNNLEYISQRENVAHAQRLIKGMVYLDDESITGILLLRNDGVPLQDIADEYNIPYHVVRDLVQGKTYNHIRR